MPTQNEAIWAERASRTIKPQSPIVVVVKNYDPATDGNKGGLGGGVAKNLSDLPGFGQDLPSAFSQAITTVRIYEQTTGSYVNFNVSPEISESKSVNYIEVSELRKAASLMIFLGSPSRNFTINAKLVSRTSEEAERNYRDLQLMKSWAMPDADSKSVGVGGGSIDQQAPSILYLYGYGNIFKGIQIVMKSINVDYPTDCDYIPLSGGRTKMPIIMNVNMSFQEIRSSEELQQFNMSQYKLGRLAYW